MMCRRPARIVLVALALLLLLACTSLSLSAAVINATPANVKQHLKTLKAGDTLKLTAGVYPPLVLRNLHGTASAWITIEGPATGAPAVISVDPGHVTCCNVIELADASYIAIRNLRVDSRGSRWANGLNTAGITHDILAENCTFVGQGARQQTVGISTKAAAWNWVIRGNTVIDAGTGMYFGNSKGDAPFINGVIENNLVVGSIGYNLQVKWQDAYPREWRPVAGPLRTLIRHNVFVKTRAQASFAATRVDGARPSVLVGGFPDSGPAANDRYEIYANFFLDNPDGEALFQGSGAIVLHDNIFAGGTYRAVSLVNHDRPIKRAYVYNNTVYARGRGIVVSGNALEDSMVNGNLVLADDGITAPVQSDNVVDALSRAAHYVIKPAWVPGEMDFRPRPGSLTGPPLDLSRYTTHADYDRDFDGATKTGFTTRGAYASERNGRGWVLGIERKVLQ